jgi:hypothetical protein
MLPSPQHWPVPSCARSFPNTDGWLTYSPTTLDYMLLSGTMFSAFYCLGLAHCLVTLWVLMKRFNSQLVRDAIRDKTNNQAPDLRRRCQKKKKKRRCHLVIPQYKHFPGYSFHFVPPSSSPLGRIRVQKFEFKLPSLPSEVTLHPQSEGDMITTVDKPSQ